MTKMAATPIYGKKLSKTFFSGTGRPISTKFGMYDRGLLHLIVFFLNDDPRVDFELFYDKVKFGNLSLALGKSENSGLSRSYCSLSPESW